MDPDRLKITQVGDSDVGKSCMLRMFTENLFMHQFMPTYGVDYKNKTIEMEDQTMVKLQIWDTAGQPTMRKIVPIHISGSDGVMVFFDLNSRETYESVREWMQMIAMDARNEFMQIILIGTKADLTATRVVSNEEAVALAAEFAVPYIETSTKDNTNVAKAFKVLAMNIIAQRKQAEGSVAAPAVTPAVATQRATQPPKAKKSKSGCCVGKP